MNISLPLVKAIATIYTEEELNAKIKEFALAMIENPDVIITATSGTGQSYTKQIVATPDKLIELFTYALEYKQTGVISAGGSSEIPVVAGPIY